jgi:hypothetical protein
MKEIIECQEIDKNGNLAKARKEDTLRTVIKKFSEANINTEMAFFKNFFKRVLAGYGLMNLPCYLDIFILTYIYKFDILIYTGESIYEKLFSNKRRIHFKS